MLTLNCGALCVFLVENVSSWRIAIAQTRLASIIYSLWSLLVATICVVSRGYREHSKLLFVNGSRRSSPPAMNSCSFKYRTRAARNANEARRRDALLTVLYTVAIATSVAAEDLYTFTVYRCSSVHWDTTIADRDFGFACYGYG